jgi:membrane-bound lytic murein transglycosylase
MQRNDSYVFFTPIQGNRAQLERRGLAGRSLATDKTLFRAARSCSWTRSSRDEKNDGTSFHQLMFDQDTGGAIRTRAARISTSGVGPDAEAVAGRTQAEGQMYYLFLKLAMIDKLRAERTRLSP